MKLRNIYTPTVVWRHWSLFPQTKCLACVADMPNKKRSGLSNRPVFSKTLSKDMEHCCKAGCELSPVAACMEF